MIDVLNLKLLFVTDVRTERSGLLSEPGSIFSLFFLFFFHSNLNLLMEFLYFIAAYLRLTDLTFLFNIM